MATAVPPPSTAGVQIIHLQIAGQRTADIPAAVSVKLPFIVRLLGMEAKARAIGGTAPVIKLDAKVGGDSLLSAPLAVTAAAFTAANFVASTSLEPMGRPKLTDESVLSIDLDVSGTNPTVDDIDIDLTVARE
jgi:hypothetical protein